MNKEEIVKLLPGHPKEEVEKFAAYCLRLFLAKKDGKIVNTWMQKRTAKDMATLYERVAKDGLVFDGVHISLQSTGISYDYIAYKNKMFLAYPESTVDVSLVYEGDEFSFSKENGKVIYTHTFSDPFGKKTENIIGAYCVIKNKRGEFFTKLSKDDIEKHRKVAKTDFIWQKWYEEMAMKTIIKKACKQHFSDVYQNIETIDNDNYDLENPLDLDIKYKQEIDAIQSIDDLAEYHMKHTGRGKEFDAYVVKRKKEIEKSES